MIQLGWFFLNICFAIIVNMDLFFLVENHVNSAEKRNVFM